MHIVSAHPSNRSDRNKVDAVSAVRYPINDLKCRARGHETETFTKRLSMNKTVVIVIVVIAVVVIGLPLGGKLMQSSNSSEAAPEGSAAVAGSEATAEVKPPALDANSLANTVWSMKVDKATLTVTLQPGGTLIAQSPMLKIIAGTDTVSGTWSVSGSNLTITAVAGGKSVSETAVISGDQILIKGNPAKRIQ